MPTVPLNPAEHLTRYSEALGVAAALESMAGRPEVAQRRLAESDRWFELATDMQFPMVGQGHAPVETAEGDWPGCTGVLRAYPSGMKACDCGDSVIEAGEVQP